MGTDTTRNLFRYPLWLTPEASFIVRRHEPVYAVIIPLWLQARGLLPIDAVVYGIMPGVDQCAVALLCEVPPSYPGKWQKVKDSARDVIDCCILKRDFPGAEDAMPALNDYIKTYHYQCYVESGPWLMEKPHAYDR